MAKLISTKPHRANNPVSLAIVGTVTFDQNCEAVLEDEGLAVQLKAYLEGKDELGYQVILASDAKGTTKTKSDKIKKVTSSKTTTKSDDDAQGNEADGEEEEEEEESDDEAAELVATLKNMDSDELKAMAAGAGLPEEEYKSKNTKALRKYLAEKLA